jgi:excinuclease UvrABC ATPase subunit
MFTLHHCRRKPKARCPRPKPGEPACRRRRGRTWIETLHSNKMCSPATGKSYDPPTPKHFSFNAPAGACPVCHGLGQKMVFDERWWCRMELPLEGAIQPWRRAGKRMNIYYKAMLRSVAGILAWPGNAVQGFAGGFQKGPAERHRARTDVEFKFWRAGKVSSIDRPFEGVLPNLERLATDSESEFIRNRLKAYMSPQFCDVCGGRRLKPEILAVTLGATKPPPQVLAAKGNQAQDSRPVHHGRLRAVGGKGGRFFALAQADRISAKNRRRSHQGNPRAAGLFEKRRAGLSHAGPRERHA